MKKKLLATIMLILFSIGAFCQEKINLTNINYDKTIYIFNGFRPNIIKCDVTGSTEIDDVNKNKVLIPPHNSTFFVHSKITKDNKTLYVIQFRQWTKNRGISRESTAIDNLSKRSTFNFISNSSTINELSKKSSFSDKKILIDNITVEAFFLIEEKDLADHAYIFNPKPSSEFTYGTITYLARIRQAVDTVPGRWSSDLNLGLTAGIKKNFSNNFSVSLVGGIAYTRINLDSISTRGTVKSSLDKPALTTSLNVLFSYKSFSLGFGRGWDWINEDSKESKSWVYNKKGFWSIAFGFNIFNSENNDNRTSNSDQ